MKSMIFEEAVSTPDSEAQPASFCLLSAEARAEYQCVETAQALSSPDEDVRICAYWRHYKTHVQSYQAWASYHGLFDPTLHYEDPLDCSEDIVTKALFSFREQVFQGKYDYTRGMPCHYLRRSIRYRHTDIVRQGQRLTPDACLACWTSNNKRCPAFNVERPWEKRYHHCHRLPVVESFDQELAVFLATGLQDEWPPVLGSADPISDAQRPVEDQAIAHIMLGYLEELIEQALSQDQREVLIGTFLGHKSSREIALSLGKTPASVDQIRRRALLRLCQIIKL
jgi:RNA polymerase sigma factor (sigma-70 family)